MPSELYNLGRVTGFSAWEVYVRQSLLLNPDIEPLSEREWLSETIGLGDSMLLKVTADSKKVRDFAFPETSLLGAPRTIIGSFFYGEGVSDTNSWCKKVTDYGLGISNTSASNPGNGSKNTNVIPSRTETKEESDLIQKRMLQYIKIQDAVILQKGVWSNSETTAPAKTFEPDITVPPTLRITFREPVTEDFFLLLTGFVNRAIIKGEVGFDMGSVIPDNADDASAFRPENGDFLGPTLYPWANKVVFTYPGVLTALLRENIKSESKNLAVSVDKDSINTTLVLSTIKAGAGVQVDDTSTLGSPKPITISARIEADSNNYLQVVSQASYDTSNGSVQYPTKLKVSPAQEDVGIGIAQPTAPGGSYRIAAKMEVSKVDGESTSDPRMGYLRILQGSAKDVSTFTTHIIPAKCEAGKGITVVQPTLDNKNIFTVSAPIRSANNYLKVTQQEGSDTEITVSTPKAGKGITIGSPSSAGETYEINAEITSANNYLKVVQDGGRTSLTAANFIPGDGIAITPPTDTSTSVQISSKIEVDTSDEELKRYLSVTQNSSNSNADVVTTKIIPAKIIAENDKSRIIVTQPQNDIDRTIKLGTKLSFTPHNGISIHDDLEDGVVHIGSIIGIAGDGALGMGVRQNSIIQKDGQADTDIDEASTELFPSKLKASRDNQPVYTIKDKEIVEEDLDETQAKDIKENGTLPTTEAILSITYGEKPGDPITFRVNVDEIMRRLLKEGPLANFMQDLLNKIYRGDDAIIGDDGHITWPKEVADSKIPMGNLNIYSDGREGEYYKDAIRSREANTKNDISMK